MVSASQGSLRDNPFLQKGFDKDAKGGEIAVQALQQVGRDMQDLDDGKNARVGAWALATSGKTVSLEDSIEEMRVRLQEIETDFAGQSNPFSSIKGAGWFPATITISSDGKIHSQHDRGSDTGGTIGRMSVTSTQDFLDRVDELLYLTASDRLKTAWHGMSNAGMSMLLSDSVQRQLGRGGASMADIGATDPFEGTGTYGDAQLDAPETQAIVDAFVQAQYDQTQKYLKEAGIEKVEVWRGYRMSTAAELGEQDQITRPITSYSLSPQVAAQFSRDDVAEQNSYLAKRVVDAKDIFSVAGHGVGVESEQEITVLNAKGTGTVYRHEGKDDVSVIDEKNFTIGGAGYVPSDPFTPAPTPKPVDPKDDPLLKVTERIDVEGEILKRHNVIVALDSQMVWGKEDTYLIRDFYSLSWAESSEEEAMADLFRWADAQGITLEADPPDTTQFLAFGFVDDPEGALIRRPESSQSD